MILSGTVILVSMKLQFTDENYCKGKTKKRKIGTTKVQMMPLSRIHNQNINVYENQSWVTTKEYGCQSELRSLFLIPRLW